VNPTRPPGRRLDPVESFEVTPWRALALYRFISLAYAVVLTATNVSVYPHRLLALAFCGGMIAWSVLVTLGYEQARFRAWPLLGADLVVTASCLLATRPVIGANLLATGKPTLTVTWMACPVLAVAVVKGIRWGAASAVIIGGCDLAVHSNPLNQSSITSTVIMVMAAAALGYLSNIGTRAQEQMRMLAATEAAHAERDRLARHIHDSVLQVLALVKRRGEEIGGEAAELGQLAGEQELALRALIRPGAVDPPPTGMVDLRDMVGTLSSPRVTVSAPGTGMWLPTQTAREMFAAIGAATENAYRHCPPETRVWILLEDERDAVTATVRDDGPGIPAGRLEQAAAQGRLGVAQSIRGRIADLGGRVVITTAPGQGTEVELRVDRRS
jgi:signal transduction histidine kinase